MVPGMSKFILPVVCLLSLLASAGEQERAREREREHKTVHVTVGHGGLVLIAVAGDGLAIATDGSSFNADGTVSLADKLLAVGGRGALALGGTVSIQDPIGRAVRQEVNVSRLAAAWLQAHPEIGIEAANRELNAAIASAVTKFFATRDPGPEANRHQFDVIFAGFIDGKPSILGTRYFLPKTRGGQPRTEPISAPAKTGDLLAIGPVRVKDELLTGKSAALGAFKTEAPVAKFRSSKPEDLSAQDFAGLFDVVLRAAESEEGKKLETGGAIVAPRNSFAVVTTGGFEWKKP
jgi:hypothetical protein